MRVAPSSHAQQWATYGYGQTAGGSLHTSVRNAPTCGCTRTDRCATANHARFRATVRRGPCGRKTTHGPDAHSRRRHAPSQARGGPASDGAQRRNHLRPVTTARVPTGPRCFGMLAARAWRTVRESAGVRHSPQLRIEGGRRSRGISGWAPSGLSAELVPRIQGRVG